MSGDPLQLHLRYVHGQVRATPWDRAVNSGETEWPPAPWRLARALLSVWHTRCSGLDEAQVTRIVRAVAQPPWFLTPETRAGHTRHYLPDGDKRSHVHGDTRLTLDPHLSVDPQSRVVVHWPTVPLDQDDRAVLARVCSSLGYLGRSESRVEACVVGADDRAWTTPVHDGSWWVPAVDGSSRVLCGLEDIARTELEVAPDQMRKAKRLSPVGSRWVTYRRPTTPVTDNPLGRPVVAPRAMRWRLLTTPAIRAGLGIAATEHLREAALEFLPQTPKDLSDNEIRLRGKDQHNRPVKDHAHAHWFWLMANAQGECLSGIPDPRLCVVSDLVLWVRGGIPVEAGLVSSLAGLNRNHPMRPRRPTGRVASDDGPRGFVRGPLQLVSAGRLEDVAPELCGSHVVWRSATPYLITKHHKASRGSVASFVADNVREELQYRGIGTQPEVRIHTESEARVRDYRRHRVYRSMATRRPGFDITLIFAEPVPGPVSLGALNHYGFGRFLGVTGE